MIDYDELYKQYSKRGIPCPTREMIKTPEQIEGIRAAGVVNNAVLDAACSAVHAGMSTEEINTIVHNKTLELGGIPAPLNFEGFPKSVCTSVNDVVCHGIPNEHQILKDGDIINIDCTTIYNGYYADASRMVIVGLASEEARKLVKVTQESVDLAVSKLKPYARLRDIGFYIENYCKKNGFSVVHEIGGHGVGLDFHEDPFVYHYGKKGTGIVLFPGMVFTIEPMVNQFKRHVCIDGEDNWTIYTVDGGLSAQVEYTIAITEDGVEILSR